MSGARPRRVAVSYSWKEEREGSNKGAVERFCAALNKVGVEVVRDIDRLKHGECISTFMRSIGASDFLGVFLSDTYLRSPNCMYELLVAWQRSMDNPTEFRQRVKVWVMPGGQAIHKVETRFGYLDFWKAERERRSALIQKAVTDGLSAPSLEEFRRIKQFAEHVDAILCFFADTLSPGSENEFTKWIVDQFPTPSAELSKEQLANVYENTIEEIEGALNLYQNVRQFLTRETTGLIHQGAESWKLSDSVRNRQFDVCPHLEKISKKIGSFNGQSADWMVLGEIAGGLVILGIDREWVSRQKKLALSKFAEFPADDEAISLGGDRRANLLHLVACALADGRARLEKVFGKPPDDEFRMPDAAQLMRGIGQADHEREVMLHFIRFILGPDTVVDEADSADVELKFTRTKKVMKAALLDDRTPYVATGESYRRLTSLIRDNLKIEDLLLIHPSGDDPESLLVDNVRVLRFLGKIFDAVQSRSFR